MSLAERWQNRTYRPFHRLWPKKSRKAIAWLMPVELGILIVLLVIFGISQPDLYRSKMWRIGYDNGLNSNPAVILYAYANHESQPEVAFVWSRKLTDFNVAISVVSLFFLIVKLVAFIMKVFFPIIAILLNISLVTLYAVSVYGQVGPDYTDERYPSPAAWYFRFGCDMAKPYGAYSSCQIAQASLGVTLVMLVVYLLNLGFSAYAMWPNPANDVEDEDEEEGHDDGSSTSSHPKAGRPWEMQSMAGNPNAGMWQQQGMKSPGLSVRSMPFTPRTQAFHTLDRQLPLRSQQAPRYG